MLLKFLKSNYRKLWMGAAGLFLLTAFFPIYVPAHTTHLANAFGMIPSVPVAVLIPALFLGAFYFAIIKRKYAWWFSMGLLVLGTIMAFVVGSKGNQSVTTPQPYTAIIYATYGAFMPLLVLATLMVGCGLLLARRLKSSGKATALVGMKTARQAAAKQREQLLKDRALQAVKQTQKIDYAQGALYAAVGPIVGAAIWVGLWQVNFIASFAAYIMVVLTLWLYRKGAGTELIDRRALYIILGYTIGGLLLAFFASFSSDAVKILQHVLAQRGKHFSIYSLLTDHRFWDYDFTLLKDPQVLRGYVSSLAMSVGLCALGLYSTVIKVLIPTHKATEEALASHAQNSSK